MVKTILLAKLSADNSMEESIEELMFEALDSGYESTLFPFTS